MLKLKQSTSKKSSKTPKIIQGKELVLHLLDERLDLRFDQYCLEYNEVEDILYAGSTPARLSAVGGGFNGPTIAYDKVEDILDNISFKLKVRNLH